MKAIYEIDKTKAKNFFGVKVIKLSDDKLTMIIPCLLLRSSELRRVLEFAKKYDYEAFLRESLEEKGMEICFKKIDRPHKKIMRWRKTLEDYVVNENEIPKIRRLFQGQDKLTCKYLIKRLIETGRIDGKAKAIKAREYLEGLFPGETSVRMSTKVYKEITETLDEIISNEGML